MSDVLDWNGSDLPAMLRSLPPGRYVVESVDDAPVLTAEQEAGLEEALRSVRRGDGIDLAEARRRLTKFTGS